MEHHELITKAKEHVALVAPLDGGVLSAADFPRVRVREVAMIYFESDQRKDRVIVFLDRATGDFITSFATVLGL